MGRKKKEAFTPDFLQIPYKLVEDTSLNGTDRMVYGAVYFYSKMRGERCFASNSELARLLFSSAKTVGNSLNKLDKLGYISRGFVDQGKRVRSEIIPEISMRISPSRVPHRSGTQVPHRSGTLEKTGFHTGVEGVPHRSGRGSTQEWNPKNAFKTRLKKTKTAQNKDEKLVKALSRVPHRSGQSSNLIENNYKEKLELKSFDPLGQAHIGTNLVPIELQNGTKTDDEKIVDQTNKAIGLFLQILPGDFIGKKTAFAKPQTREAVKELLKRKGLDGIQTLVQSYDAGKADKFRPEAGTVYEFCTFKLAKIESYVSKSLATGLYAQRSISTPEQSAVRDKQYEEKMEKSREKMRKAKEDWEKEELEKNHEK